MDLMDDERIDDDEVEGYVRGLDQEVSDASPRWNRYRHAYRNEFWIQENPWSGLPGMGQANDPFPIKVENNIVWPFIQSHIANLFYRAPRTEVLFPSVTEVVEGRPVEDDGAAERVRSFDDEWIRRSDLQEVSTHGLQQALFFDVAAFKLGIRKDAKGVMSRVWVSVIPKWELLWDDRAQTWEDQAYRGHIRWERIDRARRITGDKLEGAELEILPDVVENEGGRDTTQVHHRAKKYVRILEFYDLIALEQRFYLVTGVGSGASCKPVGKPAPIPWTLANGRPGVPILPIILSNEPGQPLKGVSAVARTYQIAAEKNLLLTIVANGLRRDAARLCLMESDAPDELIQAIRNAVDGDVVKCKPGQDITKLLHMIQWPGFSSTLDKYWALLGEAKQDSQGMSDLMQGKQGKYLSATEADYLAGTGETTAIEIGTRMSEAMARTVELMNVIIAEGMGKSFHVKTLDGRKILTKDELLLPWTIGIVDAGTTPMREGKKKAEFTAIQAPLLALVKTGSAPVIGDPTASPEQQANPNNLPVTPEMQLAARLQYDHMVQLYGLPDTFRWENLQAVAQGNKPEPPDPAAVKRAQEFMAHAVPEVPPVAPGVP